MGGCARGPLFAVFRGVYRVGQAAPSLEARYVAAVRACWAYKGAGAPDPRSRPAARTLADLAAA